MRLTIWTRRLHTRRMPACLQCPIVASWLTVPCDQLVWSLRLRFRLLAMDVPVLLEVVSHVHAHGQRIPKELGAEIPRVQEAYENIPLRQSLSPIEILGEVTQRRAFTSYHDYYASPARTINCSHVRNPKQIQLELYRIIPEKPGYSCFE
ncbi:hypothetical protein EDD18DRAFT_364957 [Armillaria luteobubalina]|uniref:Uncharacterized protein n=1 Tax=Armillaria luteobubalina TaxID=153913 RepID=A0AA39Q3N3_9AGAR|nr:hypothetical protein EDD18DRAFT_364957 [Armillaria luteobubalina]